MKKSFNGKNIKFSIDNTEIVKKLDELARKSSQEMAIEYLAQAKDEILRLSGFEVPHDTGQLQASGGAERIREGWKIFYNMVYAAYQHEGVRADGTRKIQNYQKGRKGKYLEDPVNKNAANILNIIIKEIDNKLLK
jgi:hypothetical protein